MSEHHLISDLMTETMSKIKEMVDVNTIIGSPIVAADGTTVIPVLQGVVRLRRRRQRVRIQARGKRVSARVRRRQRRRCDGFAGVLPCHRQGRQCQHPRHQRTGVRHGRSSGRDDPGCDQQGVQFRQRLQGQDRGRSRSGGNPVRRRIKPRFPAKPTRVNAE